MLKTHIIIASAATAITILMCRSSKIYSEEFNPIVVVELFSSQGCSSCPPADRLIGKTIAASEKNNTNAFVLSFHGDYWDYLGWKDPFSSKQFTERQRTYVRKFNLKSSYTPQVVINGSTELVGSDEEQLSDAINKNLKIKATASFKQLQATSNNNEIKVSYTLAGTFENCEINVALISISETTLIKRGENAGVRLVNDHIVKQFITENAKSTGKIILKCQTPIDFKNYKIIAYVQDRTLKTIGASSVTISE